MLHALDLRVTHGDTTIFDGLSLTLQLGDRAGLVGSNGAGKSSLLRVLAGEAAPERGTVARAGSLRVGHLPQEPPGGGRTLGEHLARVPHWRRDAALRALGIAHLPLDAPLASLSGGEAA